MPSTVPKKESLHFLSDYYFDTKSPVAFTSPLALYREAKKHHPSLTFRQVTSRRTFKKGYLPSSTQEIFTVTKIIPRVPPVYRLRDYTDDEIEGVFYAEELQKVQKSDDVYKIEKILAEKKENGKVKVLVKWLGYDKKFNTWIPKSELRKL